MSNATRSQKLLRTARTWLLTLGLFASTLVGCAGSLVREDDTLASYRRELAKLVETGELTNDDAAKFYGLASLEIEWRAHQRAEQRHWPLGTGSTVSSITK
jgi:predicted secreted hydrolase